MKIEKTPSGSYRVRQQYNKKRYIVTFDHKPNQREIIEAFSTKIHKAPVRARMTFKEACAEYVNIKENILSVRTIREYKLYVSRYPEWFVSMLVDQIEQNDIQRCVNELSSTLSPKTVRCLHGFISAVLRTFRPDMVIYTTLPQKKRTEPYIPTQEEVKRILEYTKEHAPHFYIPIVLACYGLRRSEIMAITSSDIDGTMLHINKALVENSEGEWIVKSTKTEMSTRDLYIPKDVADQIRKQGYAYRGGPQSISNYLRRTQTALNMPPFSLHKLRHYFASVLSSQGVPDADIMALGGWKTDAVMKTVYRHAMSAKTDEGKRNIAALIESDILPE